MTGTVRCYREDRGFGFVGLKDGVQFYFHIKNWLCEENPCAGDRVQFELKASFRAGYPPEAANIRKLVSDAAINSLAAPVANEVGGAR